MQWHDEQINTLGGSKVSMGIIVLKENYKMNEKKNLHICKGNPQHIKCKPMI